MTREEAIKVLEAEKKFLFHGSLSDKHYEPAFDMAIEALKEREKDGGLISRQAAIDALDKDPMGGLNYNRILKDLPSAQKTGKWIHKSEHDLYPYDILTCSACGETDARMYRSDEYCPHCGARMEERG